MLYWLFNKIRDFLITIWCDFTGKTYTTMVWEDKEPDEDEEFV